MKTLLFYSMIAVILLNSCSNNNNAPVNSDASGTDSTTKANQENAGDWITLFDGKTTYGWHSYGKKEAGSAWKVEDSILHLDASQKNDWQTKGGGDLVTNDQFDNFHLQLDWKISRAGNSGIIFYLQEDTAKYKETWNTGLEMQIADNDENEDGKINKHRAGEPYDLIPAPKNVIKKAGEWNHVEIVSNQGKLDFYVNGEHTISTTLWDDAWKDMLSKSKFATMPGFGTFKNGHIALQDHGADVWFRNIRIKRL